MSCRTSSIFAHSAGVQYCTSAPSIRSSRRLPSYSSGGVPVSASTARIPSRAATAATQRQQFDCSVPHVMSVSAFCASASPTRNSSLRILLPVSSRPVRSSRLTQISTPTSAESRSSFRSGVGASASSIRGIGGAESAISATISSEQVAWQGIGHVDLTEQALQHARVAHGIVAIVVVEGDVDLVGGVGRLLDLRQQLAQLRLGIEVVVLLAHRRLLASELPRPPVCVAAVQPEDRHRRRHLGHPRNRPRAHGRVDDDVGHAGRAQHCQRVGGMLGQPRAMAKLHRRTQAGQPQGQRGDVLDPDAVEADPGRELEQHVAELAGVGQRRQRRAKQPERLVDRFGRELAGLDLAAVRAPGSRWQQTLEIGGQRLGAWVMSRHQRVGLDVEQEPRRRARGPAGDGEDVGDGVIRGVHLDDVEEARVIAQTRLRRHRFPRIEGTALDERLIGPGADADADTAAAQTIFSYTPGGITRYTRIGCETFLKLRSPSDSSTKWLRMRSAVVGPTTISSPCAEAASRAATFVVGPVAVNVQRRALPTPSLVAPTTASQVLRPMWSCADGTVPPYSSFRAAVGWRMASAARVTFTAQSPPRSAWKITIKPSPAVSLMSPWCAWMISKYAEKYVCTT